MGKVLKRTTIGNGYGCSCCAREDNDSEWINEDEMLSKQEIANIIISKSWNGDNYTKLELVYEREGEVIYGYYINYGRTSDSFEFFNNGSILSIEGRELYNPETKEETIKKINDFFEVY